MYKIFIVVITRVTELNVREIDNPSSGRKLCKQVTGNLEVKDT